jgi:hypothetical protein
MIRVSKVEEKKIEIELLITCKTCKHYGGCRTQPHCLTTPDLGHMFTHPKYPYIKRKFNSFSYLHWIPNELLKNASSLLLTDEDFEL